MQDHQVKCQVRKVITSTRWRDEDNVPTNTERPPSIPQKQGVRSNLKRGRQVKRHLYLSLEATGAAAWAAGQACKQSPGSARRGLHVNPVSRHSKHPRQEGSNIRPSEG